MKKNSHPLIRNTFILTSAGLMNKIIGFFYKIFLISLIGAEGIGVYQMVFPIYILCVSLASSGIQTAISHYTAEKRSTEGIKQAASLFRTGLMLAVSASLILSLALYGLAEPVALHILGEERCLPLLRMMALAIPFETIHNCTSAWFLGQNRSGFPALSQLLEQIVRVLSVYLLYQILCQKQTAVSPLLAAEGLLAAEFVVALFSLTALAFQNGPVRKLPSPVKHLSRTAASFRQSASQILAMALPITGNRLMLNLLQSAEAAMIPLRLEQYYGSSAKALSTYGIFTGMVMPLIMFPCAVTGSFSMALLPSVSEAHALKNNKKIAGTIQSTLMFCLFLGIICTAAFLQFGPAMGNLLYHEQQVGAYLLTLAWICPFLYLTTTLSSILHGLEKTMNVFLHNLIGLLIRLFFIYFCVPRFGIQGCLWGMLASQLVTAFLDLALLKQSTGFSFSPAAGILVPSACCLWASGLLSLLRRLLPVLDAGNNLPALLLSCGIWGCLVLLPAASWGKKLIRA
ncbi:MAG: polysaccharide biosynthesis protein [Lachnospiraceae bacterium]|nr:polysaccharide biosynthesis protein [Lachnospiraceae bacterium]